MCCVSWEPDFGARPHVRGKTSATSESLIQEHNVDLRASLGYTRGSYH